MAKDIGRFQITLDGPVFRELEEVAKGLDRSKSSILQEALINQAFKEHEVLKKNLRWISQSIQAGTAKEDYPGEAKNVINENKKEADLWLRLAKFHDFFPDNYDPDDLEQTPTGL